VLARKAASLSKDTPLASKFLSLRIEMAEELRLSDPAFMRCVKNKWLVSFSGWRFRAWDLVERHRSILRSWFAICPRSVLKAKVFTDRLRRSGNTLVGLHCRLRDYKIWLGGKFYYTPKQYRLLIRRMRRLLEPSRIVFLVCTDEPDSVQGMQETDVILTPGGVAEDLSLMSECDYIIGPPSTFSLLASFLSDKPVYHCENVDNEFTMQDFAVSQNLCWKFD
jgi:hypothetical protein